MPICSLDELVLALVLLDRAFLPNSLVMELVPGIGSGGVHIDLG